MNGDSILGAIDAAIPNPELRTLRDETVGLMSELLDPDLSVPRWREIGKRLDEIHVRIDELRREVEGG